MISRDDHQWASERNERNKAIQEKRRRLEEKKKQQQQFFVQQHQQHQQQQQQHQQQHHHHHHGDEREEDTGVKNLKARNLHIALDSARKDRTKVTIEEGKTEQLIKEQRDRDDFASGFSKLREMKTPIDHEDIHSPYVYSDFVYSTNKVKDGVLHGEFTIAQPQKDGAIKWWTEKYECIGETIPPSPDNPNHVSQVAKPKAPKRNFKHDRSEVDELGDPQQLTYAHIEKIRDCKQRILKKHFILKINCLKERAKIISFKSLLCKSILY